MRYLGNFAAHPMHGIALSCDDCDVSWTGCAAAADCPLCGRGQEYHSRYEHLSPRLTRASLSPLSTLGARTMKPFDTLTDAELASLTPDQIARYFDYVCAEEGIGFLPDEPIKPITPTFDTDLVVYSVGDSSLMRFIDRDSAQRVADTINAAGRLDLDWVNVPGRSSSYKLGTCNVYDVRVEATQVFSASAYAAVRQAIETAKEAERQFERDSKVYKDTLERRSKATDSMRERISEANDKITRQRTLAQQYDRFLALADGNHDIAWRFLTNANEDALDLVPELAPPFVSGCGGSEL